MTLSLALFASSGPVLAGLVAATAIGASAGNALLRRRRTAQSVGAGVSKPSRSRVRPEIADVVPSRAIALRRLLVRRASARVSSTHVRTRAKQDEEAIERAISFVECVADLSMRRWITIGRDVLADEAASSTHSASRAILDAILADRRLALSAWYVRDAVETAAFVVHRSGARVSRLDRRHFAAARRAIEGAALAKMASPYLPQIDLDALCAPIDGEITALQTLGQ